MTFDGSATQDENDAFFNNYSNTSTGGATSGSLANRVYVGQGGEKKVRMKRGGQTITIPAGDRTKGVADAKREYLTDANLRSRWDKILRDNGLDADPIQARAIWDMAVEGASDWYSTSNGQQKVTPEQYVTWYATGRTKKKGPALPTRQVYAVTPEKIDADINDYVITKGGRTITDADKEANWYKDLVKGINELYSRGIVTEVKEVKNPETGKMEKLVTQTPGFSEEQITEKIATAFEEADPASIERQKNLKMANWAMRKMGGRG